MFSRITFQKKELLWLLFKVSPILFVLDNKEV